MLIIEAQVNTNPYSNIMTSYIYILYSSLDTIMYLLEDAEVWEGARDVKADEVNRGLLVSWVTPLSTPCAATLTTMFHLLYWPVMEIMFVLQYISFYCSAK